jgi:hypothetical protein
MGPPRLPGGLCNCDAHPASDRDSGEKLQIVRLHAREEVSMKRTLLTLLVLFVAIQVKAQSDDTEKLLDATRVDRNIVLSMVGKEVHFSADADRRSGTIATSRTFAGTDGLIILFHNFNPLAMSITATEAKTPEPVTKGEAGFSGGLAETLKLLPGLAGGTNGAPAATEALTCSDANQLVAAAKMAINNLEADTLNANTRSKWVKEAAGLEGVKLAKDHVEQFLTALNARIKTVQDSQQSLDALDNAPQNLTISIKKRIKEKDDRQAVLTALQNDKKLKKLMTASEAKELRDLPAQREWLLVELKQKDKLVDCWPDPSAVRRAAKSSLADGQKLADALKVLLLSLESYADKTKWSPADTDDYIVLQTETEANILNTITIKVNPLTLTESATLTANGDPISRDIVLREYRRLVPEFGVAAVYNDLHYPKYISKDGKVASNGVDTSNVNAAMTMNLLCNCFGGHFVYPGLQLGVSKAKDYPGLLGGFVFRFAGVKRMAFSAGRMITWYKDLDKLKIDDPASDNDIKADLKLRRAKTAFYIAAQFTF